MMVPFEKKKIYMWSLRTILFNGIKSEVFENNMVLKFLKIPKIVIWINALLKQ